MPPNSPYYRDVTDYVCLYGSFMVMVEQQGHEHSSESRNLGGWIPSHGLKYGIGLHGTTKKFHVSFKCSELS
jgi:hypothetical protein